MYSNFARSFASLTHLFLVQLHCALDYDSNLDLLFILLPNVALASRHRLPPPPQNLTNILPPNPSARLRIVVVLEGPTNPGSTLVVVALLNGAVYELATGRELVDAAAGQVHVAVKSNAREATALGQSAGTNI